MNTSINFPPASSFIIPGVLLFTPAFIPEAWLSSNSLISNQTLLLISLQQCSVSISYTSESVSVYSLTLSPCESYASRLFSSNQLTGLLFGLSAFVVTLRASEAAAQCIVIGLVCLFVCVCLWVCYHDNSKLCASILTKLGL